MRQESMTRAAGQEHARYSTTTRSLTSDRNAAVNRLWQKRRSCQLTAQARLRWVQPRLAAARHAAGTEQRVLGWVRPELVCLLKGRGGDALAERRSLTGRQQEELWVLNHKLEELQKSKIAVETARDDLTRRQTKYHGTIVQVRQQARRLCAWCRAHRGASKPAIVDVLKSAISDRYQQLSAPTNSVTHHCWAATSLNRHPAHH
jgi:hypothetical protein